MHVILHRECDRDEWQAMPILCDKAIHASIVCDELRDITRGEQYRFVGIGQQEDWNK